MGRIETLCWLASNGNLSEIKKNNYSNYEIDAFVYDWSFAVWGEAPSFLGTYNALMIAASHRHLNVVQYFVEEKEASLTIKGGRGHDFTALDCAKRKGWFGPAVNSDLVRYLERPILHTRLIHLHSEERKKRDANPTAYDLDVASFLTAFTDEEFESADRVKLVNFFMAFAIVCLQQFPNRSPDCPLYIQLGSVRSNTKYIWTAFMFLGMILPDEQFDEKSIKFGSSDASHDNGSLYDFNFQAEVGLGARFSPDSLYETAFKKNVNKNSVEWFLKGVPIKIAKDKQEELDRQEKVRLDEIASTQKQQKDELEFETAKNTITNSHNYIFTLDEKGIPTTVLSDSTLKNETIEKKQKRQALDTINMINQVLAHGSVVDMKTESLILATIATKYIDYLTTSFDFKIKFKLSNTEADHHEEAINIFNELKREFPTQKELEQIAWYQNAVKFQKGYKKDELSAKEINQERKQQDTDDSDTLPSIEASKAPHYTQPTGSCSFFIPHTATKNTHTDRAAVKKSPEKPATAKSLIPQELLSDDKEEMFLLAQFHQLDHVGMKKDLNLSFDYYIRAAQLGHPEALTLLDHIGDEMSADKQLELSHLYETFFKNDEKANYWRSKAAEMEDFNFNM